MNKVIEIKLDNLRKIRLEKEMSISMLSKKSGISKSTISRLERNIIIPNIYTLVVLANALDVGVKDLIEIKEAGFTASYKYF